MEIQYRNDERNQAHRAFEDLITGMKMNVRRGEEQTRNAKRTAFFKPSDKFTT